MTREDFIAHWGDKYLADLLRAFQMSPTDALSARWLAAKVNDLNGWLGQLHDSLTEELRRATQEPKRGEGKPGPAGGGGPPARTAPARGAAETGGR